MTEILKKIREESPDIIGFSCFVWNFNKFIEINKIVKKRRKDIVSIFGGPSVSFDDKRLDEEILKGNIDYLIVNQGEIPFFCLLNCLENAESEKLSLIDGIVYKSVNGTIVKNREIKNNLLDLNKIENPYFKYDELYNNAKEHGIIYYEMSRGCPYSCTYCYEANMPFRSKSIDLIIKELNAFQSLNIKRISVLDATLNFDIKRTKILLSKIIERNFGFLFFFEIKAECLDDELIDMLSCARVSGIEVGLQTSNIQTLKLINRYYDKSKFEHNIQKLIQKDFLVVLDLIIGLPNEGLEDWLNSLDYCYNLGDIKISSNPLKLLPNTQLYNQIDKFGYKYDAENMNQIISSYTFSSIDLAYAYRIAHIAMFFWSLEIENKKYISNIRKLCNERFGGKFTLLLKMIENYIFTQKLENSLNVSSEQKQKLIHEALSSNGGVK